ncbi:MAG: hypothetical protein RSE97_07940, partial [Oscillospiraceae bacterium]
AQNSGKIENCYSVVRMDTGGYTAGGFVGENMGVIAQSYSRLKINGLTGGFSGDGGGDTEQKCYFFHEEKEGSKKLQKLCDPMRGQRLKEIETAEDVTSLGFDLETIWERHDGKAFLRFISENWLYDVAQSASFGRYLADAPEALLPDETAPAQDSAHLADAPEALLPDETAPAQDGAHGADAPEALLPDETAPAQDSSGGAEAPRAQARVTVISTADELWELAKQINEGNRELAAAYIRLEDDISLGGREWVPIGRDRTCAFTGIFDGGGYTVKNFVIKDKKTENKGFFGFLRGGEVYNLSVDCRIKGGTCSGGIAAQNEDGIIGCCAAVIEVTGKNGSIGGLVGRNTGAIFQSYAAGRIFVLLIPWWWGLPLLGLLLLCTLPRLPGVLPTFAPVPYDEDQIPIPDEDLTPNTDGNFVSFQFEQKIDVDLATGLCKFGFKNPGNSNHNIVVQLQFTDAQAVRVMGSTGRTAGEQKRLSDNPSYDPENYRMVIAESGAIRPGYQLGDLKLTRQADGAHIPPGDYNAMVYLVFYDIETNNRAMLESQLPVVISVN